MSGFLLVVYCRKSGDDKELKHTEKFCDSCDSIYSQLGIKVAWIDAYYYRRLNWPS